MNCIILDRIIFKVGNITPVCENIVDPRELYCKELFGSLIITLANMY
jgi:hypothetical protein